MSFIDTLGSLFAKWPQKVSKSIRVFSKRWRRFTSLRNIKNHWENNVLEHAEKSIKIPYKPRRLLRLWGPLWPNASAKYQKSIRFLSESWWRLTTLHIIQKLLEIMFCSMRKSQTKHTIKPVVHWDFWGPFREMAPKSIKKALGFSVKVDAVLQLCKTSKTCSKTTFWSIRKSWWKHLMKPVVYWDFWGPFRKMASKSIKKALGFSLKVDDVSRLRRTSKNL